MNANGITIETEKDLATFIHENLDERLAEEGLGEVTGNLQEMGWMTNDTGLEIRLADGKRFLITIQRAR